ncbi:C25 family cysteine peptidase [Thermoplasmatota archaeon]
MKKIIPILIVGILVISGLGAVAISDSNPESLYKMESIFISETILKENNEYILIDFEESTSKLMETGNPIIPVITKVYTFPAGTKIENVKVDIINEQQTLQKKIQPSTKPIPMSNDIIIDVSEIYIQNDDVYSSAELYPSEPYSIGMGSGLKDQEHVIYLTIRCNSQYSPVLNTIEIPKQIDVEIEYILPEEPLFKADEFDMLIITDESFVTNLQPLVDHKNSNGIETMVETVQDIYPAYDGRDDPEDIKLRIKDAIEESGIKYVLLAGGRKGQTLDWYVPSRRTLNDDNWETGYESDLYFADIYKYDGENIVFEDWDSNGNGVFAEFKGIRRDTMDFYPDVTIGRLPIRTTSEADTIVNKIIDYENNADDSWFKTAIVISGDTFPPSRGGAPGWWEGELETGITVDILEDFGFTMNKLWLSIPGAWEGREDVQNAFNDGAGFVHFAGHSNPASWGNHPPDDEDHVFIDGFKMWDGPKLTNDGELPIVVFGGCHSAQFNVTLMHIITGMQKYGIMGFWFRSPFRYAFFEWVPRDVSSQLVMQKSGGAIASIGNSGLGYGYVNEGWDSGLGGWIEPRFFDAYANQSKTILGETHDQAIIDYINIIGSVNSDQIDRKTIEEWVLLGDPSLKIGGL